MKNIAILGSTGSIGQNTLGVIASLRKYFCVAALSANSNIDLLYNQVRIFRPKLVCVNDAQSARELKSRLWPCNIKFLVGQAGLEELAGDKSIDQLVLAISGSAALRPLLSAIESGKVIALANKEALVMAGPLVMRRAFLNKALIIPIDSEQSAIWQCLRGQDRPALKSIYLTASGGPFRSTPRIKLKNISVARVLRHPRWRMGKKISVDSATLMNKGLELLEAMYLFSTAPDKIKVLIHPQAIIHSMVEFIDGVVMAQLSVTDMRVPIQYALSYPKRLSNNQESLDFHKLRRLDFQRPDFKKFPCLGLAYQVAGEGGTAPCVLNAADEVCVIEFLRGRLEFLSIPKVIEEVLSKHRNRVEPSLPEILLADTWARVEALRLIDRGAR
jgi:1-deoxy-D-xylulose-5-phosphate reductoisomerase